MTQGYNCLKIKKKVDNAPLITQRDDDYLETKKNLNEIKVEISYSTEGTIRYILD